MSRAEVGPGSLAGIGLWSQEGEACYDSCRIVGLHRASARREAIGITWLTLGGPFAAGTVTAAQVILAAALASRADDDDTIDLAVLAGLDDDQVLAGYQVTRFRPFDPVGKRTEATVTSPDGTTFKVTKGAPQVIMKLAGNSTQVNNAVDTAVGEFAARGFRSLGVARADGDGRWQFLGVLPLSDPPRVDAKATIATARQLGVAVKMVTGTRWPSPGRLPGPCGWAPASWMPPA